MVYTAEAQHLQFTAEKAEKADLSPEDFTFSSKVGGRGFEVVFPVYNRDKSEIIAKATQDFPSQNLAQKAIDKAQAELTQFTEFKNLSQTFTPYYFSIEILPTGEIKVATPGLRSFNGDYTVGRYVEIFTS